MSYGLWDGVHFGLVDVLLPQFVSDIYHQIHAVDHEANSAQHYLEVHLALGTDDELLRRDGDGECLSEQHMCVQLHLCILHY